MAFLIILLMHKFTAPLKVIGVNPYVEVPEKILAAVFKKAGRDKGKFPICGEVNGKPYKQTLVRYSGDWRLYVNTFMLRNSPKRIGEVLEITLQIDTSDRSIEMHPKLAVALADNMAAKTVFDKLIPSRKLEIIRYIANLKTEASVDKNVKRAVNFLLGKEQFVGRDRV